MLGTVDSEPEVHDWLGQLSKPTIPVAGRIAHALDADLTVRITSRSDVA